MVFIFCSVGEFNTAQHSSTLLTLFFPTAHFISTAKQKAEEETVGCLSTNTTTLSTTVAFVRLGISRKQITAIRERPSGRAALNLKHFYFGFLCISCIIYLAGGLSVSQ